MIERARIFKNGGSQAVRLPKSFRFDDDEVEVLVRREGRCVILEPSSKTEWSDEFLSSLGSWDEDIPRLEQEDIRLIANPFDDELSS